MKNINLYFILILWSVFSSIKTHATTYSYTAVNSPYLITSNLLFNESDTVIFDAGAELNISPGVDIRIKGYAFFNGTENNPVSFLPLDSSLGWGRLYFDNYGIQGKHYHLKHMLFVDGLIDSHYALMHISNLKITNDQDLLWDDNFIYIRKGWGEIDSCSLIGVNDGEGIQFLGASYAKVANCNFLRTPDAIELINVDQGVLSNNVFRDISDDAIDLNHSKNTTISYNFISNVSDRGMEIGSENFGSSINILIEHNIIQNCNEGVTFKEGSSGIVRNNTFYNNNIALSCLEIVPGAGGSSVSVENTIFSNSIVQDLQIDNVSEIDVAYSLSNTESLLGQNNLQDNPLFEDENDERFELTALSPCVDMGNPGGKEDVDCSIPDIGALYFHQNGVCEKLNFYGVQVYPSVFKESTKIVYKLEKSSKVKLTIFDIQGKKIRTMVNKNQEKGIYRVVWGEKSSNTTYIVSLSVDAKHYQTKAIQIKH